MSKNILLKWPHILLVGSIALAIYGCLKVDDGLVGVESPAKSTAQCMRGCGDVASDARAAEQDLHTQTVHDCTGDPDCLKEENARHAAQMRSIAAAERACKVICHNQGGGGAGQ
jgi:hypothetical protein